MYNIYEINITFERWLEKTKIPNNLNDCWVWIGGSKTTSGYGMLHIKIGLKWRKIGAHQVSWMVYNQQSQIDGMDILHSCNNKACVNPSHLSMGTRAENTQQAFKDGLMDWCIGENQHNAKLTEKDIKEIRKLAKLGMPKLHIAKLFNVNNSNICQIIKRKTWKHVLDEI